MAEIALELNHAVQARRMHGGQGGTAVRVLAQGDGWRVADVVCTSGPQDRRFEERHAEYSIAIVLAGSFQYRVNHHDTLMTPGAVMLGSPGQCYECGHEHADGDRCVSFWFRADVMERLVSDAGFRGRPHFQASRIPPIRALAPDVATVAARLVGATDAPWDEIGITLAARATGLAQGPTASYRPLANAEARVTRTVRAIDRSPQAAVTIEGLAREAGVSPYHFLRTFERLTGVTPHQYVLRARLREAAVRLAGRDDKIVDVAFDCGFGDISNFNRTFRAEFGVAPGVYRRRAR